MKVLYSFKAKVWLYQGVGGWHFVSLPKKLAQEIKKQFSGQSRGWGSVPVMVTLGKTTWQTSIFPDTKTATYVLPLKGEVRKREKIMAGNQIKVLLDIQI